MQWFPACYANLATVNQTVMNITVTTLRALRAVTHAPQKRQARKVRERHDTFWRISPGGLMSNYPN